MKKIMFNDKYGLTKAVLDGNKTQTRRIINPKSYYGQPVSKIDIRINPIGEYQIYFSDDEGCEFDTDLLVPKYTVGEVVAIAQSYKDVYPNADFELLNNKVGKSEPCHRPPQSLLQKHIRL